MKTGVNLKHNNELRNREIKTRKKNTIKINTHTLTHIQTYTFAIDAPLEYILNLTRMLTCNHATTIHALLFSIHILVP